MSRASGGHQRQGSSTKTPSDHPDHRHSREISDMPAPAARTCLPITIGGGPQCSGKYGKACVPLALFRSQLRPPGPESPPPLPPPPPRRLSRAGEQSSILAFGSSRSWNSGCQNRNGASPLLTGPWAHSTPRFRHVCSHS